MVSMYSKAKGVELLLVCVLVPASLAAQQSVQSQEYRAGGSAASRAPKSLDESPPQSSLLNLGLTMELSGFGKTQFERLRLVFRITARM
jgi:hypothetical protein